MSSAPRSRTPPTRATTRAADDASGRSPLSTSTSDGSDTIRGAPRCNFAQAVERVQFVHKRLAVPKYRGFALVRSSDGIAACDCSGAHPLVVGDQPREVAAEVLR